MLSSSTFDWLKWYKYMVPVAVIGENARPKLLRLGTADDTIQYALNEVCDEYSLTRLDGHVTG